MEDSAEDADADSQTYNMMNIEMLRHDLFFYRKTGCAFLRPAIHMRR